MLAEGAYHSFDLIHFAGSGRVEPLGDMRGPSSPLIYLVSTQARFREPVCRNKLRCLLDRCDADMQAAQLASQYALMISPISRSRHIFWRARSCSNIIGAHCSCNFETSDAAQGYVVQARELRIRQKILDIVFYIGYPDLLLTCSPALSYT